MFTLLSKSSESLSPIWLVIIAVVLVLIGTVKVHWVVLLNLTLVTVLVNASQSLLTNSYVISQAEFVECMGWVVLFGSLIVSPKGVHPNSMIVMIQSRI